VTPDRLVIFAKRPIPGRVKTRLVPPLAAEQAAQLYLACLRDVVIRAACGPAPLALWYEQATGAREFFEREFTHVERERQHGRNLGEKMSDAFARSFAGGAERVVIIGSDSPTMPPDFIRSAFDDLREIDAVIGPAHDGGYYLVGLRSGAWPAAAHLFREVRWSADNVFITTMARAAEAGLELRVLPGWYDVDRIEDLDQARADVESDSHLARWFAEFDAPVA
jgi:rSAM/selenodomain-associated transferase 1